MQLILAEFTSSGKAGCLFGLKTPGRDTAHKQLLENAKVMHTGFDD